MIVGGGLEMYRPAMFNGEDVLCPGEERCGDDKSMTMSYSTDESSEGSTKELAVDESSSSSEDVSENSEAVESSAWRGDRQLSKPSASRIIHDT